MEAEAVANPSAKGSDCAVNPWLHWAKHLSEQSVSQQTAFKARYAHQTLEPKASAQSVCIHCRFVNDMAARPGPAAAAIPTSISRIKTFADPDSIYLVSVMFGSD